ncbi:MAG: hypothetical protein HOV81_08825 [Kofleriaceae bacterium]|nr:hypothetical protein [Kofleriaceae bacterium]
MKRNILPSRRLGLRAGRHVKTALLLVFMLGFTGGLGLGTTWFVSSGATILRDKDVWARGVPAEGTINAKRTSKLTPWLLASYDGTVRYTDAEGATYEGDINFWTLFGGPDTDNAELRYDPQHHEKFAISWGVEASGARWRAVIVFSILLALLTLTMAFATWAIFDGARREARVARDGDEVELRVVSCTPVVKDGKPTGKYRHELELDTGDEDSPRRIVKESLWLLYCAPNDARVLGLSLPGKLNPVIVLGSDVAPLSVSQAERAEITKRAEAARAT